MTDDQKSDDTRRPEPQVIDLDAEEVKDPEPASGDATNTLREESASATDTDTARDEADDVPPQAAAAPQPSPPPRKRRGVAGWIAGALVIGLLAGAWLYRDVLESYLPSQRMTALQDRLAVLEAQGKTVDQQLQAVAQKADAATAAAGDAATAAANGTSALTDLAGRVDGVDQRVAGFEQALASAKADLDALRSAASSGSGSSAGGTGTIDGAALAALGQRLDALEKDVASLKAGGGDRTSLTAGLSQALADIKAKIAAGTPYAEEHERIARMVPAAPGLDVLAAHAAAGLPNAQGLAAELAAAIPSLPQPETPVESTGDSYWDQLTGLLSGIVTIRDIGDTDWADLARRCAALAEAGDLTQAIALIAQAEGSKPQAINQWHDRAAARLSLEAALAQVSEAVVRQIAALGGAQ